MIQSKSTEKLLVMKEIINDLPQEKLKSISIAWKAVDSEVEQDTLWCPFLHVELYPDKRPEGVDVEVESNGVEFDWRGQKGPDGVRDVEDGLPGD